ncbi:MAG: 23S rRNA (pseudouridine(1915)-N(3))-methyltransferase RlmH [Alphaproteobacteria bacterium]|nr:23S rRNA (pseudouridine(1915)-N(3))-methyltransferase RlmH [Alphaproteobacteria bacterium]
MKVHLIAIGRARRGPEKDLFDHYISRIRWPFTLHELEEKKALSGDALKQREAELLLGAVPSGAAIVALDERGKAMGSLDLARKVEMWKDESRPAVAFIIGGADGLHDTVRQKADLCLSFGKLTWPHMLVRPMLAEQIYRVQQIHAGHPYHRE